jgi:hypothetical protein
MERPMLFSGPMVRAILGGSKTQTRRVMKPQPLFFTGRKYIVPDDAPKKFHDCDDIRECCPYGFPGDRIWVRETWHPYGDDGKESLALATSTCTGPEHVLFRASANEAECATHRWRPAIHMPRWASRISLTVTDVRVQRLQDISEEDAKAEGVSWDEGEQEEYVRKWGYPQTCKARFADLWDGINSPGSWEANPWVWAISFTVERPQ